ncbi:MAG: hypothetical protein ABR874_03940 [Candidatus Sulfotelmatobacter sp.]|jgi:CheY-like chemotaxis protein
MNTPLPTIPLALPLPDAYKKKRVLLLDASNHNRDLRAEVMRKLGIDVDCAADIAEARSWWRADLYDLVLINMEKGQGLRDRFCEDIRGATPPQRMAFLVGEPQYLANLPCDDAPSPIQDVGEQSLAGAIKSALSAEHINSAHPWGILEASRRISAVRSACSARNRALRDRPSPPRDSDARVSKRIPASLTLDDLLREEMQ